MGLLLTEDDEVLAKAGAASLRVAQALMLKHHGVISATWMVSTEN